ncbi:MAG TPA: ABC transporter permease [Vicinamibacterales bacterium]|jgi:predicted permease|nr:ABC transporter permease [Vicinamibacterales bacterium]
MRSDFRHLARTLRHAPASALAATVTVALTLAAGTSIFALVDAVLLTPPPFVNPSALVRLGQVPVEDATAPPRTIEYATFERWRERAQHLATLEALDGTNLTLTGIGAPERVGVNDVTPGFLTLLGVTPAMGRGFASGDAGQPRVILSYAFWQSRFAGTPSVIGRQIMLGNVPHVVIGVLPQTFSYAFSDAQFWRPIRLPSKEPARGRTPVGVMARLAAHVPATQLAAALDDVSRTSSPPAHVVATPVTRLIAGDSRRTVLLLGGAAAIAWLLAFANLAGLLVVRSIDRRRELAVRTALGAGRWEISRQLLLEALTIVTAGAAIGFAVARWLTPLASRFVFARFLARPVDVNVNATVTIVIVLTAAVCATAAGLLPSLGIARWRLVDVLRRGTTATPGELRLRRLFVAGEIALAFVLLVSMTLIGGTLRDVLRINPGFDSGVLTLAVSVPAATYGGGERVAAFYGALQNTLDDRFGSGHAAIIDELPMTVDHGRRVVSARPGRTGTESVVRTTMPGYFEVMRIPLAGRDFDRRDSIDSPPRVIISQALAARLFGSQSPIGEHVWMTEAATSAEVIGVAGDVKHRSLDEPTHPTLYVSGFQQPSNSNRIVVRSASSNAQATAIVRDAVARLDPNVAVYGVEPMREIIDRSPGVPARRVLTTTFLAFATLAIALAFIGLFGVMAHDIARRRGELALRVAIGANPGRLLRAAIADGGRLLASGGTAGALLAWWSSHALGELATPNSQLTLLAGATATAVILAAGIAAILPSALRAARTDPLSILRAE